MARLHSIEWADRAECLEAFATSYGDYPPKDKNVPGWWTAFEAWYVEQQKNANADGVVSMTLRTEAFGYEDEEEGEDEDPPEDDET